MTHRFDYDHQVGDTAPTWECEFLLRDGVTPRDDIHSATFKLVDMADPTVVYINDAECQSVEGGVCSYLPTAEEMAAITATLTSDRRVLGQFFATLEDETTVHSPLIEGRIKANL